MATRLTLPGHRPSFAPVAEAARSGARRRRSTARDARRLADGTGVEPLPESSGAESAAQALRHILQSATDLLGASRGFFLICDAAGVMEVACVRELRPLEVMDLVLTQAAAVVRTVLRERQVAAADVLGRAFLPEAGSPDSRHAAIFCVPLDLGAQRSGLLCALREAEAQVVGPLDLEILQGLCDQAALVIGTSSACSALAQLEACLKAGPSMLPRATV